MIGQTELLAVPLAKLVWGQHMGDKGLILFIDNESARHALIGGYSPQAASSTLVAASARLDSSLGVWQWAARVPSPSNLADGPSRLDFDEVKRLGCTVQCLFDREGLRNWEDVVMALRL